MTDDASGPATVGRLVATGRSGAYLPQRVIGWVLVATFGLAFALSAICAVLVVVVALVAVVVADVSVPWQVPAGLFGLLVISGLATLVGGGALQEVRELDRLGLVVDASGISRTNHPAVTLPWERIRHAIVTSDRPGMRQLLVDDGTGPEAVPGDAAATLRSIFTQIFARRRFALQVRIDRLDVPGEEVIRAIYEHSGQRLPDIR